MSKTSRSGDDGRSKPSVGRTKRPHVRLPGKYRHGTALTPRAASLVEALLQLDADLALSVLLQMAREGRPLLEIEDEVLEPAVTKLGEMWVRGRIDSKTFSQVGALAEHVEERFRRILNT